MMMVRMESTPTHTIFIAVLHLHAVVEIKVIFLLFFYNNIVSLAEYPACVKVDTLCTGRRVEKLTDIPNYERCSGKIQLQTVREYLSQSEFLHQ